MMPQPSAPLATTVSPSIMARLEALAPGGVHRDVDLATVSRWRVGGIADCIVTPASAEEAAAVIAFLDGAGIPRVTLGSSTNLLFADEGLRAIGVHIGQRMSRLRVEGERIACEAGHYVPRFARRLALAGLAGAEHVSGIPGTLGGLICMNGGSQRRGIGENVETVSALGPHGAIKVYSVDECGFAYRRSIFQDNDEIVVGAMLRFPVHDDPAVIRGRMLEILRERRRKFPQKEPNCGSVFVSDPAMYAEYGPPGAVIERLGVKGMRVGGAEVSPRHANFVVNTGGATAADVLTLVARIRDLVRDRTGYAMRPEGKYVLPDGRIVPLC